MVVCVFLIFLDEEKRRWVKESSRDVVQTLIILLVLPDEIWCCWSQGKGLQSLGSGWPVICSSGAPPRQEE